MLTIFITLCLSVALFTTKLYWPLSAVGFGVVFGILPLLFVAESPYHPQQPSIRDNSRNYGTTDLRNHGNWATRCYEGRNYGITDRAKPNIATLCCAGQQDDQSTKQLVGRQPLIAHNPLYNLYTLSTKNITTLQKDNGLQTTSQLRADASSKLMAHCSIPLYPFQTAERQRSPKQLIFGRIPTQSYKSGKAL